MQSLGHWTCSELRRFEKRKKVLVLGIQFIFCYWPKGLAGILVALGSQLALVEIKSVLVDRGRLSSRLGKVSQDPLQSTVLPQATICSHPAAPDMLWRLRGLGFN